MVYTALAVNAAVTDRASSRSGSGAAWDKRAWSNLVDVCASDVHRADALGWGWRLVHGHVNIRYATGAPLSLAPHDGIRGLGEGDAPKARSPPLAYSPRSVPIIYMYAFGVSDTSCRKGW